MALRTHQRTCCTFRELNAVTVSMGVMSVPFLQFVFGSVLNLSGGGFAC